MVPVTPQGISYRQILLYPTYAVFTAMAFLPYPVIDLYIRAFVSGSQPHSGHRYFIDLRPNTPGHLWLGFALSPKGDSRGCRQPTSACCVSRGKYVPFLPTQYQGKRFRALPRHSTSRNISQKGYSLSVTFTSLQENPTQSLYATTCRCTIKRGKPRATGNQDTFSCFARDVL